MVPEDIPILHPFSYALRSNVVQLYNRAIAASDSAQEAAIVTLLTEAEVARAAGDTLQPADMTQDTTGHFGRHLKWLLADQIYRAIDNADINTDLANIIANFTVAVLDTGWISFINPAALTNAAPGAVAWIDPGNAQLFDASYAVALMFTSPSDSQNLRGVNLNAPVPGGSTIVGVEVKIHGVNSAPPSFTTIDTIELIKGGVPVGTDQAIGETLELVPQDYIYGGPSNLWGTTLTDTDVNSATFGAQTSIAQSAGAARVALIDSMLMKIYYT